MSVPCPYCGGDVLTGTMCSCANASGNDRPARDTERDLLLNRIYLAVTACQVVADHGNNDLVQDFARRIGKILEPSGLWFVDAKVEIRE